MLTCSSKHPRINQVDHPVQILGTTESKRRGLEILLGRMMCPIGMSLANNSCIGGN